MRDSPDLALPTPNGRPRPVAQFWVAPEYRPHFARLGLTDVEHVLASNEGQCLRKLPDRENWRLELQRGQLRVRAFLKKHHSRRRGSLFDRWVAMGEHPEAGLYEAQRLRELAAEHLTAMRLVAYGGSALAEQDRSFIVTEELVGYEPLDDFLRRRFAPRCRDRASPRDSSLRTLLAEVAQLAARFHAGGYNHRDFYCCHLFVRETSRHQFSVSLIDLQRVQRRRRLRHRWIVKDLAQLAYSAPRDRVSCTDRLRFLRLYLGVRRLRAQDRRLVRAVMAKQHSIERSAGAAA